MSGTIPGRDEPLISKLSLTPFLTLIEEHHSDHPIGEVASTAARNSSRWLPARISN